MKITKNPNGHKKISASSYPYSKTRVVAADEDYPDDMDDLVEDGEFNDTLDDVADAVDDIQDAVDEVDEDDVTIDTDNNITNHYIAECEECHGIFISAVIQSDQQVEKISGVCPLCQEETDQYLRWVINEVGEDTEEQ